ncbi:MAG: thiamine phosphate synthase [Deltaproteobacteria bacterium]|nr:thiamine phosphate synthase [Deltaproteobacteria bacterium]
MPTGPVLHERALAIAREAHHGQSRRHGAPYLGHPLAVRVLAEELGHACGLELDDATKAVALLHDVIEDSEIGREELAARFGDRVANEVWLLTKAGKGEAAAAAYYARLTREASDAVRLVKVCDRLHNLSELHLAPSADKLASYVDETLLHLVPLARSAQARGVARGLEAALVDGIRAACRAQHHAIPAAAAAPARAVPSGLYAVVMPRPGELGAALDELSRRAAALIAGGAVMLQLRCKERTDREQLALLEVVRGPCARAGVPLIVNDRADLCATARAHGVHVGQTDLPPPAARAVVGAEALVGASSHTEPQLFEACAQGGADHVAVGPIYLSATKQGHAPVVGLEALARRAHLSPLPVVAIGGVTSAERAAACGRAGAALVAVAGALDVEDPRPVARRLAAAFVAARAARSASEGGLRAGEVEVSS